MLRIHCLQLWFNLSDPGMEQELYDSRSMLEFAGLSLSEPIPDETTILHFRHLLERHQLGTALFATINAQLAARGLQVREGTIVDSTIISAPSSTKNRERARDPEMHQTRKTPQDAKGSSSEVLVVGTVSPGGRLVVGQAALQAAVQVADEAVGEGAQRLVV